MSSAIEIADVRTGQNIGSFTVDAIKVITSAVRHLVTAINYIGIVALFGIMVFTSTNVFLRYVLHKPITGSFDITELLMVIMIACSFAFTAMEKGHVNVNLIVSKFPLWMQRNIDMTGKIVVIGVLIFFSWQTALQGELSRIKHVEAGPTGILIFPFYYLLALGFVLMAIVIFSDLLKSVSKSRWYEPLLWLIVGGVIIFAPWWVEILPTDLSPGLLATVIFLLLFTMLFSGLPIGIAMALMGIIGSVYMMGLVPMFGVLKTVPYRTVASETLSVVPMFVLMGEFAFRSGISTSLYNMVRCWIGQAPGGMAMATTGGCAGFAAICGSTSATAVSMGTIALPEMEKYKYDPSLAAGCVAAGGTLGILIPPSVGFIVYGLLTEQSIGKLFFAGVIPGILLASLFMASIYIRCRINPELGPAGPKTSLKEKIASLRTVWPVLVIFVLVLGGFYVGIFTPTEAGAVGALGVLVLAVATKRLDRKDFITALISTAKTTGMIFLILIGAMILGYLMSFTKFPFMLARAVSTISLPPVVAILAIIVMFLILGCVMESLSMCILIIPIIFPAIKALGFDLIWFGVIIVLIMESGLITPPIGMNVFIIHGICNHVPMYTIFRGIMPFLLCMVIMLTLLIVFPQIALFLPNLM